MPFNKCHGICTLLRFFCVLVCTFGPPLSYCNPNDVIFSFFFPHGHPSQVVTPVSKYLNNFKHWDLKKKSQSHLFFGYNSHFKEQSTSLFLKHCQTSSSARTNQCAQRPLPSPLLPLYTGRHAVYDLQ